MNFILNLRTRYKRKKFYSKLINKNDLCFDIGANLGAKSKLFLSLGARVIAFEPQTACQESLAQLKRHHARFDFHQLAAGAKNGAMELFLANHIEVATLSGAFVKYFSRDGIHWDDKETVTVKSLDFLIETFGLPDFCKIDTEGFEHEILSSLSRKIPLIEFEFTGGFVQDTLKIIDLFGNGKSAFNYILNENLKFCLEHWTGPEEMKNIIRRMPRERLHGNIYIKTQA